jgi:signal transduction histidine kinase
VGAAAFLLAALVSIAARSHVPGALLGILFLLTIVAVARYGGVLYAVPVGVVTIEAFDWYFLPPTRSLTRPDAASMSVLGLFIAMSVLVGVVAVRAGRRAAASEGARGVLADEQAALRRVATLVARQPSPEEVFAAVTEEVGRLLHLDAAQMLVHEGDGTARVVATWSLQDRLFPLGTRLSLEGDGVLARAFRTQRPARLDDLADAEGPTAEYVRSFGIRAAVGTPIVVEGRVWGLMTATSLRPEPLPAGTESRIGAFTELVATAIANAEARTELERVAAEQAALGRVATLVAEAVPPTDVFAAVAAEVAGLFGVPVVGLFRYEPDRTATVIAAAGDFSPYLGRTFTFPPDGPSVLASLLRTGRPSRLDDYAEVTGTGAEVVEELGLGEIVGAPVIVDSRVWGTVLVGLTNGHPRLPENTVERLTAFTELVATAIANAEAGTAIARLAEEQAALRRVATLVARGVQPGKVFAAVAEESGRVMGVSTAAVVRYEADATATIVATWGDDGDLSPVGSTWPLEGDSVSAQVFRTRRSARMDGYDQAASEIATVVRRLGGRSTVGAPIVIDDRLWGAAIVTAAGSLPAAAEGRIANFTELVGIAISNTEFRDGLRRLAEEQAALRRVATLVAEGGTAADLFSAVAREVAQVLDVPVVTMGRYESDATSTVLASLGDPGLPVRSRWPLDGPSLGATVFETGRPARIDDYSGLPGPVAAATRESAIGSTVGVPISVDGKIWGLICVGTTEREPLPADTEERLAGFTEVIATAIANSEARDDLGRLAAEQAALRRVATLVAKGATPTALFSAVGQEVARVLDVPAVTLERYESDATSIVLAAWGESGFTVGSRRPLDGGTLAATVFASGRPARIDDYAELPGTVAATGRRGPMVSAVGVPIAVDGKVWGLIRVGTGQPELLPADTEARLSRFTELVATAVSNATTRAELTASRARVVAAADETRRRIERDLHDGLQQRLVSLAFKVRAAETMTPRPSNEVQAELSQIQDGLRAALDELREIARGIHPAILSKGGLCPALKALARRSAIPVELDLNLDSRLAEPLEVAAYYVASEAITNAVKHAHASVIELHVDFRDGELTLSIRDDGVGGADPSRGSGIIGLTDRVQALGGTISVVSPPGDGTTVHVQLPADPSAAPGPPRAALSAPRSAPATAQARERR